MKRKAVSAFGQGSEASVSGRANKEGVEAQDFENQQLRARLLPGRGGSETGMRALRANPPAHFSFCILRFSAIFPE
jgi:hypothetical protein